jgi:ribosomal protein L44E
MSKNIDAEKRSQGSEDRKWNKRKCQKTIPGIFTKPRYKKNANKPVTKIFIQYICNIYGIMY